MDSQLAHNKLIYSVRKSFCEDVNRLLFGNHKRSGDPYGFNFLYYKVSIIFNKFGLIILNWIIRKLIVLHGFV